jgi:hypothetical protein
VQDPGTGTDSQASNTNTITYSERLYVTWYWWPLPMLAALILAAEIHMGYGGLRAWLPYAVLLPLTAALIIKLGLTRIRVTGTELRIGDARLPREFVGEIEIIPFTGKRRALGPDLDPAAFVVHRSWVRPLLRMQLTDPADPTPYWIFSTRHPERLAELLRH